MNFIKLRNTNGTSVYINAEYIRAVYYDSEEKLTAVDYGEENTFYVFDHHEDVIKMVYQKKGGA